MRALRAAVVSAPVCGRHRTMLRPLFSTLTPVGRTTKCDPLGDGPPADDRTLVAMHNTCGAQHMQAPCVDLSLSAVLHSMCTHALLAGELLIMNYDRKQSVCAHLCTVSSHRSLIDPLILLLPSFGSTDAPCKVYELLQLQSALQQHAQLTRNFDVSALLALPSCSLHMLTRWMRLCPSMLCAFSFSRRHSESTTMQILDRFADSATTRRDS